MKTKTSHEILVGLLFFGALTILVTFTAVLTGYSLGSRQILAVSFPEVAGLSRGDNVRVAGLKVGRVHEIDLAPDGGVEVRILLEREISLHEGYSIRVEDATLLGGKVINIDRGKLGTEPADLDQLLEGESSPGAARSLGQLIEDNRANLKAAIQSMRSIVETVESGRGTLGQLATNPEIADRLSSFLSTLDSIATEIMEGQGVLGGLIRDQETWTALRGTVANLNDITGAINRGEGTLGKMLRDDELFASIRDTATGMREIVGQVQAGEGTLGKLLYDDEVYEQLLTSMSRFAEITVKMDEGEGALATLLNDPDLGRDLQAAASDLREILATVRSGDGTLGQLVKNGELYDKILDAVASLGGAIEDARETAPINTFTSSLFSIF